MTRVCLCTRTAHGIFTRSGMTDLSDRLLYLLRVGLAAKLADALGKLIDALKALGDGDIRLGLLG